RAGRRLLSASKRNTPSPKPASPPTPQVRRIPSVVSYHPSPPAPEWLAGCGQIVKNPIVIRLAIILLAIIYLLFGHCRLCGRQGGREGNYLGASKNRKRPRS